MRILYIHQYFASRKGRTGTRSYEFGRYLAGKGHEVTMITSGVANAEFPLDPNGKDREYSVDGIRVLSVAGGYNDPHMGTTMGGCRRMLKFCGFWQAAVRAGKKRMPPNVVFATHTPLTVGLAGAALGRHFGVPFVFEVRDLWPQALVNVGALRNPVVIQLMKWTARHIYRAADHIIALSPGMKQGIVESGIEDEKVTVIPNASDLDLFRPDLDGAAARERLGLGERFAGIYFGAMGLANGLEYVVEAAKILAERKEDRIVLVLHGDGGARSKLESLAKGYGLTNVVFSDLVADKGQVARIVAGCDVCLTIYRAAKEQSWSPNKMFDALAAGRPVLINVGGWLGETIEQNECGLSLDPARPEALADALVKLSREPDLCKRMGANARALAERQFDRNLLAGCLEEVLAEASQRYLIEAV
ncbi:MAG: glycosyltransferase family 4 protein [Phycisphaerales bacterium]